MAETVQHPVLGPLQVLGVPTKLSDTPGEVRTSPPMLGEHTRKVLEEECGMPAGEIDGLVARNVVACRP